MKKYSLLMCVVMGLLTCSGNQPTVTETATVVPTVLWKTSSQDAIPGGVDSVRITISSSSLSSSMVKMFSYKDNKGTIPSVPVNISITIKIEGIDSLGRVLYSGSVVVPKVTAPTMDITIEANQVTPIAPSDLVAQTLSYNSIRLIWKENSTNETYYLISRQINGSTTWDSIGIATQNTFTDSTLAPVTQYQYRIIAVNAAGRSAATTPATATTLIMDKTGPLITITSFKKIDTVNTRTVTLYGTAHDTSGIYQVMINDVVAQLNGNQWIKQNYYLSDTVNTIVIKATDNSSFKNVTLDTLTLIYKATYVDTTNHSPVFTVTGDSMKATVKVGQTYKKTLRAFDVDANDTLRFVVSSFLTLLGKDTVLWVPKITDIGLKTCYALVYDIKQAHDSIGWSITVLDSATPIPNHPPVFVTKVSEIQDSAGQNKLYTDTLVASDQDVGQKLTYSIVTGPSGLAIGGTSGIITWTPPDTGTFTAAARVTDDSGAHAEIGWTITVVPATVKVNHPPQFVTKTMNMTGTGIVGTLYKDSVTATDPDSGAILRFSVVNGPVRIDSVTGIVTWTPTVKGNYSMTVRVTDNAGAHVELSWPVTVNEGFIKSNGMNLITSGKFNDGQVQITLTYNFWIDSTEVTQADYLSLMGVNPSFFTGDIKRPVEQVTWFDAVLYCNTRSKRDGFDTVYSYSMKTGTAGNGCTSLGNLYIDYTKNGYRLSTFSEWEYAYRAGTTTNYYWGNDSTLASNYAWWSGNSGGTTQPVATKLPNAWGLYDMNGNVWEWCNDWYSAIPVPGTNTNPIGPDTGTFRMMAGGSCTEGRGLMPAGFRGHDNPSVQRSVIGFRCVRHEGVWPTTINPVTITALAAGGDINYSLLLTSDGTLWACGQNIYGLFVGGTTNPLNRFTQVQSITGVRNMVVGWNHNLIMKNDGSLWACGNNDSGQIGDGTTTSRSTPVQIMSGVRSMAAGGEFSLILKEDSTLWACGANGSGQLGDGTIIKRLTPEQIMSGVQNIAAGQSHSLILKTDGTLWVCGGNYYGELGDGNYTDRHTPVQIMSNVKSMNAGFEHSLILKNDGTLWACGYNADGQLGDGTTANRSTPVQIMNGVQSMSVNSMFSLILKSDGSLWSCGNNAHGQLGYETATITNPTPMQIMTNVKSMAAGQIHSLILKNDFTFWACGWNMYGQLGDGTNIDRYTPVQITF